MHFSVVGILSLDETQMTLKIGINDVKIGSCCRRFQERFSNGAKKKKHLILTRMVYCRHQRYIVIKI